MGVWGDMRSEKLSLTAIRAKLTLSHLVVLVFAYRAHPASLRIAIEDIQQSGKRRLWMVWKAMPMGEGRAFPSTRLTFYTPTPDAFEFHFGHGPARQPASAGEFPVT